MSGIATTLRIVDQMTAPIVTISNAINNMVNRFNAVEQASDINATSLGEMRNQVDMANSAAQQMNDMFVLVGDTLGQMTNEQNSFNGSLRASNTSADKLLKTIGSAVADYASIRTIGKVLNLSDELTSTAARLNLMNDGLQTTKELQDMIYLASERSRGSYLNTAASVSKLGMLAGDAFGSTAEMVAFAEQLNKQFVISGASVQETTSAMYQLTQAMASGRLQGDEYRSIIENAPLLAGAIEDYMRNVEGAKGSLKEWASDGLLTAGVIKNALFAVADETDARFEQMPMTFGQIWTSIKNQAIMQFQPILDRLNDIANSPGFQTLVDNVINAFIVLSAVVTEVFNAIASAGQFISANWSIIGPIVWGIVAAMTVYITLLTIYNAILAVSNGITAVSNTLKAVAAIREAAHMAATTGATAATFAQTVAQYGLNAAMLACPLTWIILAIIAIIAIIYAVVAAINHFAGTSISATGVVFGAFAVLGAFLWNLFLGLLELVFGVINAMINPFIKLANFIANIFKNPISSIIYLFQGMADNVLAILETIASALDFIFGSKMGETVAGWRSGLKGMADAAVAKYAPNENYQNVAEEMSLSVESVGLKRWAYGDAWESGYQAGENLDDTIGNFDPASLFQSNIPSAADYTTPGFDPSSIEGGVANIDANTKGQLDYSEEELKLWRDIAERDTINRFTTAEVNVDFGGIVNHVSSDMDLDGIVSYIEEHVEEALLNVAEGVHE